ncbi:MAG: hypothetical protein QF815_03205, partial [Candidatus Peribacteraceae bacterium]|nr:hypothetical protein [Candidatus Peribacteraceae bacterium]
LRCSGGQYRRGVGESHRRSRESNLYAVNCTHGEIKNSIAVRGGFYWYESEPKKREDRTIGISA